MRASSWSSPSACPRLYTSGREALDQFLADQVGIARPARGDVAAMLDDKRVRVVLARAALGQLARSALEVFGPGEGGADLVLDIRRVRAVVAAAPPERREIRRALHV